MIKFYLRRLKYSLIALPIIYVLESVHFFEKIEESKQIDYVQKNVFGNYSCTQTDTSFVIFPLMDTNCNPYNSKTYNISLDTNFTFRIIIIPSQVINHEIVNIDSSNIIRGIGKFKIEDLEVKAIGRFTNIKSFNHSDSLFNFNFYFIKYDLSLNDYGKGLEFKLDNKPNYY